MTERTLSIRMLGPLEVAIDGVPVALGGKKQRMVLGALLLDANKVVSVDRLIDAVWGETAAETASSTLQVYISKLRRLLEPGDGSAPLIVTVPPGYSVRVSEVQLDLLEFETAVTRARRFSAGGDHDAAAEVYRAALDLWQGTPLADLAGEDYVASEVTRLELNRMGVVVERIDAELARGHHAEVTADLTRLVAEHPLDERVRAQLMVALYRSGRHTDALATFQDLRTTLGEELGLEPGREIRDLEERILMHDPALMTQQQAPVGATVTVTRPERDSSGAVLEVAGEDRSLARSVTTIGRLPDRAIVITDPDVSRRHAEIRRSGDRYTIFDVGSANGTRINGDVVAEHELSDGDVIEIGDAAMVFKQNS